MLYLSGALLILCLTHAVAWRLMRRWSGSHRIMSWFLLGAATVCGIEGLVSCDDRVGKAARAYARLALDEAGDRVVIPNGVADEQMVEERISRNSAAGRSEMDLRILQFRTDEAYRTQLVAWVRREWPAETNLWMAAEIGPEALADAVYRSHPDRVYVMTGESTTPEKWSARWTAMKPYLGTKDSFSSLARQAFALEGKVLSRRLLGEGKEKEARKVSSLVRNEILPNAADPVRECLPDLQVLVSWNNEMIRAHGRGDLKDAAGIARKILTYPEWRAFIPANAVMGSVLAREGDYEAAELFFRVALSGEGPASPQPVVLNDYADALRHLGRYDEAEALARRAIAASGGKVFLFKRTLRRILRDAGKSTRS